MRLVAAIGFGGLLLVAFACSEESRDDAGDVPDGGASSSGGSPAQDAGADVFDAEPVTHTIAIHVTTPSAPFSRGGPATPTWAVRLSDDRKTWETLAPKGADGGSSPIGEYELVTEGDAFRVAFACADDRRSLVSVFARTTEISDLDVELAPQCGIQDTETTDLTGTFTGLGADTGWLDFGYAFDRRGAVFPTNGGSGDYELVNLVAGTWDLAFGVRDDFGRAFTKLLLVRDQVLPQGSATFDADLGAGPSAFVPGTKKLTLAGTNDEPTHVSVLYTLTGATNGLELGPADDATRAVDYPAVPPALQRPADRYRVTAVAEKAGSQRGGSAVFHDAADLAIELPPAIDAPTASVADAYVVTKMKPRAGAEVYAATVFTKVTNQSSREWRVSTSASLVTASDVELSPPDLRSVRGFKSEWLTPLDLSRTVTAAVHEKQIRIGDGHLDRFAQSSITMDSP